MSRRSLPASRHAYDRKVNAAVRDDRERLQDILDAICQVERHLDWGRGEFDANELVQVWLLHAARARISAL